MNARLTPEQLQLAEGRPVIWAPQPRQSEFLAASEDEVLYGGAAGGGKSDAMLIDALGLSYGAISNPNHRAILFRRTFPELADLISRSNDLYLAICPGAKYNKVDHEWTFPSGAKISFAHLQHDDSRLAHRGKAYNWIGFEELTLWASAVCWDYLASRNRSTDPSLPCYMRATTNPDGPGQKWVMERWGISPIGAETRITREVEDEREVSPGVFELYMRKVVRRFIPARLTDNAYLRGTGYRAKLNDMPDDERNALLHGLWSGNRVRGAYYVKQMAAARASGRIRKNLPLARAPINTFWDLGWNDCTSIVFQQYAAGEHRFPLAYENSGEELAHYAEYLARLKAERGWYYGAHYLPHDAEHKSIQTGKSAKEQLELLMPGERFVIVPVVPNVLNGINQTRARFPLAYFDEEGCSDLIAALDGYRKQWDRKNGVFRDQPEHGPFSHYADAFRQWGQGWTPMTGSRPAARPVQAGHRIQ